MRVVILRAFEPRQRLREPEEDAEVLEAPRAWADRPRDEDRERPKEIACD